MSAPEPVHPVVAAETAWGLLERVRERLEHDGHASLAAMMEAMVLDDLGYVLGRLRDLYGDGEPTPPICGQDTREVGSRVTAQCALPAGHAGLCSAEEEG